MDEPELNRGMGERDRIEPLPDVGELGARPAQEATARGHIEEQIIDLDRGAEGARRRPDRADEALLREDRVSVGLAARSRGDAHARDRRERREGLAAKAERPHPVEILGRSDLAGRMPSQRERQVLRRDAAAVIAHPDAPSPAGFELDLDTPRPRIQAVLDELLDRRGRTLDHLAGRDLIDQERRQRANPRRGGGHARMLAQLSTHPRSLNRCRGREW